VGIILAAEQFRIRVRRPPLPVRPHDGEYYGPHEWRQCSRAPATFQISANATVSGGTVTNAGISSRIQRWWELIKRRLSAPPPAIWPAASYASKDYCTVATAAGCFEHVRHRLTLPWSTTVGSYTSRRRRRRAGNLSFSYNATPGLRYVVQNSSDLISWSPEWVTNMAASSSVPFSDGLSNAFRFYRVGRLPLKSLKVGS